ncbi:MAG: hypothetical protein ABL869_00785, partial [Candidatus Nitrotoga sp.]
MSLEDAIKEVAAAIRYYADVQKERTDAFTEIQKNNAELLAIISTEINGYENEQDEPAPVVSLAEKRKEKADADTKKAKTAESEYVPG